MIRFFEDAHKYIGKDEEVYTSVTKVIHSYEQDKDWDKIARTYSKKHGIELEEVKRRWDYERDKSVVRGNKYHKEREVELLNSPFLEVDGCELAICPCECKDGIKYSRSLKLEPGIYPELIIWLDSAKIAGQADYVEVVNGKINIKDYKGLALGTPIPTKDGFKNIEDVCIDDILFDGDGNPTTVKNVSSVHYNPCYKIHFDTKDSIVCDHEHRWVVARPKKNGEYTERTVTTEELVAAISKGEILYIRCSGQISTESKDLSIDPYVLGCWLGDGSSGDGKITNMDDSIWNEIVKRGYSIGDDVSNGGSGKASTRTVFGLRTALISDGLLNNKHIPEKYLRASKEQRLDLLRGLMDTDGHFNRTRNRCVMVTTKEWQAKALSELVASLGLKPNIIKAKASGFGKGDIDCYHVVFRSPKFSPFLCKNADYNTELSGNPWKSMFRKITKVEKVDTVPTKCLEVDSPTHTYLFGRHYIKTHNTNKEIKTKGFKKWDGTTEKLKFPLQNFDACNYNIYSLQLNMYMYMLLRHNPGLKKGTMELLHIQFDEDDTPVDTTIYKIKDLQTDVKRMIGHWMKTHN